MKEFFFSVIFVVKISQKQKKNFWTKKNEFVGMAPKP